MKQYERPTLRRLGTLSVLTMGMNGSCPDGGSQNITQLGGGHAAHAHGGGPYPVPGHPPVHRARARSGFRGPGGARTRDRAIMSRLL